MIERPQRFDARSQNEDVLAVRANVVAVLLDVRTVLPDVRAVLPNVRAVFLDVRAVLPNRRLQHCEPVPGFVLESIDPLLEGHPDRLDGLDGGAVLRAHLLEDDPVAAALL